MANPKTIKPEFVPVPKGEVHDRAAVLKADGWRYINTNATALNDQGDVELLVMFAKGPSVKVLRVELHEGDHVTSVSDLFFCAFVFENEAHDLFGVNFDGLAIDFKGTFYKMALDRPMNPEPTRTAPADKEA